MPNYKLVFGGRHGWLAEPKATMQKKAITKHVCNDQRTVKCFWRSRLFYYLWHTRWRYITYDTRGDGKYQFSAICRILNQLEFQRSPETLRRETVSYLEHNPVDAEGFLLDLCLEVPFSKYLDNMSNNGTYCDGNHRDGSSWTINIELVLVPPLGRAQK